MSVPSARRLSGALVVAVTFALGLTRVEDSDAWTHLALGRLIVGLGGLPSHEVLSYPSGAMPFYDTEWLFDVLLYLAWAASGFAGVIVLKAAVLALVAWVLWRDAILRAGPRDALRPVLAAAVVLVVMLSIRHRFVERPDLGLMLFIASAILVLRAWLVEGRPWLWGLPLLQAIWVNVHPSAIVVAGPFAAVVAGGLADRRLGLRLTPVAVVFGLVGAASCLNPYGIDALTLPFRLATTPWFTQEIAELQRPALSHYPMLYVLGALLVVTFLLLARRASIVDVLLVAPFAWLGFSAARFVFLFAIVAAPVLARNLAELAGWLPPRAARRAALPLAALWLAGDLVLGGLALAGRGPFGESRKVFGLGVDAREVPERALAYLDRIGATGRIFNAFHWGGYVAWRDFPRRAAIVDGRGYVPPDLVEEIHFARAYPAHLARLAKTYGFDAAVVDYPAYAGVPIEDVVGPDADRALTSPEWALVYWDDVALVYLRRGGAYQAAIERDEYRRVKPANGAQGLVRTLAAPDAGPEVAAELARNVAETGSSVGGTLLGFARLQAGALDGALEAFGRARDARTRPAALQGQALAWWRKKDFARAADAYREALALGADARAGYLLGAVLLEAGDARGAADALERALRRDSDLASAYPALAEAYRRLGEPARGVALEPAWRAALAKGESLERQRRAVALIRSGDAAGGVRELTAAVALTPADPRAHGALGDAYLALGRLDDAVREQHAALALDPRFAGAHLSLGLIFRQRGDARAARTELREYARLEPRSYTAWQLRRELGR
ncbi:MAG: tetratricopeptide repeat protein [Candidatus Rokuibacteriota bacterium]